MADFFGTVAECQPQSHPENAVGDAPVIRCAAVDRGKPDSVSHHFIGVQFAVNAYPVAQCTHPVPVMQENIIDPGQDPAFAGGGDFGEINGFNVSTAEHCQQGFGGMIRTARSSSFIPDGQFGCAGKKLFTLQKGAVSAVSDHQFRSVAVSGFLHGKTGQ